MATKDNDPQEPQITLETATRWARSNREWEKVYRYIFLHTKDFFVISPGRQWPIAHQVVFHGNLDVFKRILALFSDHQIDIRSKSADGKTLLNVAIEKRDAHPAMFTYVNHLFAQDELIEQAKQCNWRSVTELLEKDKELANEKPPYSSYFLLHYVVEYGDAEILQNLLDNFQFLTNVLNTKNETPLDMAIRLNKNDIRSILRPKTVARPSFTQNQPETPPKDQLDRSTYHAPINPSTEPKHHQPQTSMPTVSSKPVDQKPKLPCIGFGGIVLDITKNGDFTVGSSTLFNSIVSPPLPSPPQKQQPQSTVGFKHVQKNKSIVSDYPLTNVDPPLPSPPPPPTTATTTVSPSSSNEQLKKNLTCTLTQQIFVDPVIASDGQTYERAAIVDWVNIYHCSPITGAPMDAIFRDNTEIREIIQSIKRQS